MSVINQMLTDLDKRRTENKEKPEIPIGDLSSPKNSDDNGSGGDKKKRRILIILLFILAFVVLFWLFLPKTNSKKINKIKQKVQKIVKKTEEKIKKPLVKPTTKRQVTNPTTKAIATPAIAQNVVLQDGSITQEGSETILSLTLDELPHYILQVSDDHQHLTIRLDKTNMAKPILQTLTANTAITDARLLATNKALFMRLTVRPNTQVEGLVVDDQQQPLRLILKLSNPDIEKIIQETTKAQTQEANASTDVGKMEVKRSEEDMLAQKYQSILLEINQGQIPQAIQKLQALLNVSPNYMPARKTLVILLIQQKQLSQAAKEIQIGLTLNPASPDLTQLQARMLVNKGRIKQALKLLKRIDPSATKYPNYYAFIAALQQKAGNYLMAAETYEQLLKKNPDQSLWWMGLGLALESEGRPNTALEAYRKAVSTGYLNPNLQAYVETKIDRLLGG